MSPLNTALFDEVVERYRQRPRGQLWKALHVLSVTARFTHRDEQGRQYAIVRSLGSTSDFHVEVWGYTREHILAKALALRLSSRLTVMTRAKADIEAAARVLDDSELPLQLFGDRVAS